MYAVITSYLEDSDISSARVVSVLKDFMEKSNLAEFDVRLDIVYVYHCHLIHLDAGRRRGEIDLLNNSLYSICYTELTSNNRNE